LLTVIVVVQLYGSRVRWSVRIASVSSIAMAVLGGACASAPNAGPVGEGSSLQPKILSADTARPPRSANIELDKESSVALLLVAPGHSATLLYPRDSATNNRLGPGAHQITFQVPAGLVLSDTALANRGRMRQRADSAGRPRQRTVMSPPIDPAMGAFLLLLTSPQRLDYARMVERTSGVSIPTIESEALNAIAKAIKSTLPSEPRDLAGYYMRVELANLR
jgi:hypothetical protein